MEPIGPWLSEGLHRNRDEGEGRWKQPVGRHLMSPRKIYKNFVAAVDTIKIANVRIEVVTMETSNSSEAKKITEDKLTDIDTRYQSGTDVQEAGIDNGADLSKSGQEQVVVRSGGSEALIDTYDTNKVAVPETPIPEEEFEEGVGEREDNTHP